MITPREQAKCRSFGILLAFMIGIGFFLFADHPDSKYVLTGTIAVVALLMMAIGIPSLFLTPLNGWLWAGAKIGHLVSPIILGIIFYLFVSPIAVITRAFGRDELKISRPSKTKDSFYTDISEEKVKAYFDKQY